MWPIPTDHGVVTRMRTAHHRAQAALRVQPDAVPEEAWGWHGRTLGRPVVATHGPAWLRLASTPTGAIDTTFWDGSVEAEKTMPATIPRPRLRDIHDWTDGPWQYRAELHDRITTRPTATAPVLTSAVDLPPAWWATLRTALDTITGVATTRHSIKQSYLDHTMPELLGTPINTSPPAWTTAHGDLHFANLCAPTLHILDWEGWGLAPAGYDAATLHTYSLLIPAVANRIRNELAHLLDTPTGRFAELVAITELLHSTTRGEHPDLAEPLRDRATHLLRRKIPRPALVLPNE